MDAEKKFLSTVKRFSLISKQDRVLVAFSGGPDSVLLVKLLLKFKSYLGVDEIALAHFNHMLRVEAVEDEKFCTNFAQDNGLRFFSKKVDIKQLAKAQKRSVEDAGREERYKFLTDVASREGFNKIATAHHLSDLAETMTLWFLQGNKRGLRGFRPKTGSIIRPLYYLTKEDILEYCNKNSLDFVVDASNFSEKYMRNRVRMFVIPILKELNTSLETSLERMSYFINLDEDFFTKTVDQIMSGISKDFLPLSSISGLDDAVVYRVFHRWAELNGVILSYKHLREVVDFFYQPDKKKFLSIAKDKKLFFTGEGFKISGKLENQTFSYKLKVGHKVYIKEAGVWIESFKPHTVDLEGLKNDKNIACFELDADEFLVRSKLEGDKMVIFGHKSYKKLKDIFIDIKIPKNKRNSIPLLVFGDKILWVCGYKRSADYPVTESSKNVICFKLTKEV